MAHNPLAGTLFASGGMFPVKGFVVGPVGEGYYLVNFDVSPHGDHRFLARVIHIANMATWNFFDSEEERIKFQEGQ